MQQKCTKRCNSALSSGFLLKSLDEIERGKIEFWINVDLDSLFYFQFKNSHCPLIISELMSGNAEGTLKKAEEVMKMVQRWSEKEVPNKKEVLGTLHSCIGNALIDLGNMDKALEHHQKDLELAKQW